MTKYTIVTACALSALVKYVQEYIDKGWQVQGGLAIDTSKRQFSQAMTWREPPTYCKAPRRLTYDELPKADRYLILKVRNALGYPINAKGNNAAREIIEGITGVGGEITMPRMGFVE